MKSMSELCWDDLLFSDEEFHEIYEHSKGFTDEVNTNHRSRCAGDAFADFMDRGCDSLIAENLPLVKSLMQKI